MPSYLATTVQPPIAITFQKIPLPSYVPSYLFSTALPNYLFTTALLPSYFSVNNFLNGTVDIFQLLNFPFHPSYSMYQVDSTVLHYSLK